MDITQLSCVAMISERLSTLADATAHESLISDRLRFLSDLAHQCARGGCLDHWVDAQMVCSLERGHDGLHATEDGVEFGDGDMLASWLATLLEGQQ